jgi:hypothetical protein
MQRSQDTLLSCSLEQVSELVRHHLHLLWRHPERACVVPPLMLWGPPGVGKSSIVRQICAEEGIGFIDIRLAQREPVDLRGLPVPRGDAVHWLLPAEWPRDADSKGILLFDELTAADRTLQVAAYELILDRRLGDLYRVPPGWYLLAAGNRSADRAVATTLSSALANRFCHLEVAADLEVWVRWAQNAGVHPDVTAFLRFRPECFLSLDGNLERGWPSPRSWERVGLLFEHGSSLGADALRAALTGLVGHGAATEMLAFRSWSEKLTDVIGLFNGAAAIEIPSRADQRYALCSAVAWHLWRHHDRYRALHVLFDVGHRLPSDFAAMLMVDALNNRSPEEIASVTRHPRFGHWTQQHGAAFASRYRAHASQLTRSLLEADDPHAVPL